MNNGRRNFNKVFADTIETGYVRARTSCRNNY